MRFARATLFVILTGALPAAVWAQSRVTGGDIRGKVLDPAGTAVGGAPVTVTNQDTNLVRSTDTDTGGRYFFAALPPGRYTLTVMLLGFGEEKSGEIVLALGHSVEKDFKLRLTGGSETVTVVATPPSLDARRTAVAFSVGQQQIENLPTNGRNFVNFAALTPGVTTDRTTNRGIISTSGLSFTGQPARNNSITVDGFDNNDVTTGGVRGLFSQEAVREFQVLTDSYSAEFGRASGGVVNIVTKSGTNDLHGNAFFYLRDKSLNAREHFEKVDVFGTPIDQAKAPFRQYQWGATLGGALRRDKTFFFLSYENVDVRASNFVNIDPTVAAALGRAGFPVEVGYVPYDFKTSQALGKLDHQWSANDTLSLRASFSKTINENAEAFGGLNARSNGGVLDAKDWFVSAAETDILSSKWVSETRVLISRQDQSVDANDPVGPQITIPGVAVVGRVVTSPQTRKSDRFEASETLSYFRGSHLLKAGASFAYLDAKELTLPLNFGGNYVFSALPGQVLAALGLPPRAAPLSALEALAFGLPAFYAQGYGNPGAPFKYKDIALFAQDEWRAGDRLTLRLGVRYQRQLFPDVTYNVSSLNGTRFSYPLPQDKNDFAPRLGISFDPSGHGKTSLHGAYGKFFDDQIAGNISTTTILGGDPSFARSLSLRFPNSIAGWRAPGHRLPEPRTPYVSAVFVFDPNLQTPYSHQASLGLDQQIGKDVTFSINGLYIRGKSQLGALDLNPLVPSLGAGRRPNDVNGIPGSSGPITQFSTYGESWYRAVIVALGKTFSNRTQFMISYTLSKAEDTSTDFFTTPEDGGRGRNPADPTGLPLGFDPLKEKGPSINDQRHRLVFSGMYEMPWKLYVSAIATYGSGRPFNPVAGVDLNGSGDQTSTPPDRARRNPADPSTSVGRNSETTASTFSIDMRLSKKFGLGGSAVLEAIAEAFNLLDRVNFSEINNTFGTGAFPNQPQKDAQGRVTYGLYTKALPPRQIQLALKFAF
jgi:hypothetical protein